MTNVGNAGSVVEAQGDLEIRERAGQRAAEELLDAAEAVADGAAVDPEGRRGRGDVPLRGEVGAQRLPRRSAAVPRPLERLQVEPAQRGGEELVAVDRGEDGDVGVAKDGLAAALG